MMTPRLIVMLVALGAIAASAKHLREQDVLASGLGGTCDCESDATPAIRKYGCRAAAAADKITKRKCERAKGVWSEEEAGPQTALSNAAQEAQALGQVHRGSQELKMPDVGHSSLDRQLATIKRACGSKSKAFVAGAMCEHDQCVVERVSKLLRDHVNIMDCNFNEGVRAMCEEAPNGKDTKWKNCETRWDAYQNKDSCAVNGLSHYDGGLTAYGGFVGQTPSDVRAKFPGNAAEGKAKCDEVMNNAARYQFNDITAKGCAVCATVAQGGFYAYTAAGLLGRIDLVEENYGGGSGHIFLLYSTRNEKPSDANDACPEPTWSAATCYTQFIDNWYAGLQTAESFPGYLENMVRPDLTGECVTGNCAIPYSHRTETQEDNDEVVTWHKQNRWTFRKPRNNDDEEVDAWPKTP